MYIERFLLFDGHRGFGLRLISAVLFLHREWEFGIRDNHFPMEIPLEWE